MTYVTITVDVDIEDIIYELSNKDKQELVDELYSEGFVAKESEKLNEPETDFDDACIKLFKKGYMLTTEEEQLIISISKKIP